MKEKLIDPVVAVIAAVCILYVDLFTISIKNVLFVEVPDYLRTICSLSFTIILWGIAIALLFRMLKSKTYLNLFHGTGRGFGSTQRDTALCMVIVLCVTVAMWIMNGGFKPLRELQPRIFITYWKCFWRL